MQTLQLSVVVPVYNAEKTIKHCVESIIVACTSIDSEILLINDGSTDSSHKICTELCETNKNVKLINISNGGPSKARNTGLNNALGEYIAFVDSDDTVMPNIFHVLLHLAIKNEADIVICNYNEIKKDSTSIIKHCFNNDCFLNQNDIVQNVISKYYEKRAIGLAPLWNKIFKKDFINSHALKMDEKLCRGEDWWFTLHAFEMAKRVCFTEQSLYNYFADSPDSLMKKLKLCFYDEWKESAQYLLTKNNLYRFPIDYNILYKEFLYNTFALFVKFSKSKKQIKAILKDQFYKKAIKYNKYTSFSVRFSHFLNKWFPHLQIVYFKFVRILNYR